MNSAQRGVIAFTGVLVALMLLVPPFQESSAFGKKGESLGYHLVGMAPEGGEINIMALLIQLVAMGIGVAGVWWACGAREHRPAPPESGSESGDDGQ